MRTASAFGQAEIKDIEVFNGGLVSILQTPPLADVHRRVDSTFEHVLHDGCVDVSEHTAGLALPDKLTEIVAGGLGSGEHPAPDRGRQRSDGVVTDQGAQIGILYVEDLPTGGVELFGG